MDELAIKRMMDHYGSERQESCHLAAITINYLIKELTLLKSKAEFNQNAEPKEKVNMNVNMIPNGAINELRKHLANIDKYSEVLETLDDMLPEPDAE